MPLNYISVTHKANFEVYDLIEIPILECGRRQTDVKRIIGGTEAAPGSWPWQIGMYYSGKFVCGGSLVNKNWIITAGYCVKNRGSDQFIIHLGETLKLKLIIKFEKIV